MDGRDSGTGNVVQVDLELTGPSVKIEGRLDQQEPENFMRHSI